MTLRSHGMWVAATATGMLVASCKSAESESTECAPGLRGCQCGADAACENGLTCLDGFCVPAADCARGSEGCACFPDGACAAEDDEPLACLGNVCTALDAPAAGALGGACSADGDCASIDGELLACVRGACERQGCPSGSLGCPCGARGSCERVAGQPVHCVDSLCALGACADGACEAAGRLGLVVSGAGVRACDVLVELHGARPRRVTFPAAVMGTSVRQPRLLGFSLLGRGDAALQGTVAELELASGRGGGSGSDGATLPTLVLARCFDAAGVELAEPMVALR